MSKLYYIYIYIITVSWITAGSRYANDNPIVHVK